MRNLLRGVSLLVILAVSNAASSASLAQEGDATFGTVSGTVSYLQRIALPDNAEIVVELSDVSRMDVPATLIASQRIITNGRQVPIPYSLSYDSASIRENGRYTVRAKIFIGGELRWTSDTAHPVVNNGEFTADINVIQVSPPAEATEAPETAQFGTVTGTVTYLQRIALPDNAIVQVTLTDLSQVNAPPLVMAVQQIATNGRQVPIAFALNYDQSNIVDDGRYEIRATVALATNTVLSGNEVIWRSEEGIRVISNDVFDVEVMLVQAE